MSTTATSKKTFGTTGASIRITPSTSTLQSSINGALIGSSIAVPVSQVVAEAELIIREAHTNYLHSITLPEIGDDYSVEEEAEWDALFAQPHVQAGLDLLEEEAMRQIAAGEFEESGFEFE